MTPNTECRPMIRINLVWVKQWLTYLQIKNLIFMCQFKSTPQWRINLKLIIAIMDIPKMNHAEFGIYVKKKKQGNY
jgi:hypothetical protein